MSKASGVIIAAVLLCVSAGAPAAAEIVRVVSGPRSVFDGPVTAQKPNIKAASKSAQRHRAALQQRLLLQQEATRRQSGAVEQTLDRLRRQQAETLRAQQYGQRYYQRQMPPLELPSRPRDTIGQRLDALRQQQADTLRDQQRIGVQQQHDMEKAIRGLRN